MSSRIAYRLKRPLGDVREKLVLEDAKLLRKLAALTPRLEPNSSLS